MKLAVISLSLILVILLGYQISFGVSETRDPDSGSHEMLAQGADADRKTAKTIPPMDMALPPAVETASFGLG